MGFQNEETDMEHTGNSDDACFCGIHDFMQYRGNDEKEKEDEEDDYGDHVHRSSGYGAF